MSRVRCLYCDGENDAVASAGYCEGCGKKLPPAALANKRREPMLHDRPDSLSPEPPGTPMQQASAWLFTAALVNLIGCGGLIVLGPLLVSREQLQADFIPDLMLVGVAVLLALAGLGWWARRQPIPAATIGTIVYLGLAVVEALLVPGLALPSLPVKIVTITLLTQAVRVSRKPRRFAAEL
jgi:hypothetical protein